MVLETLYGPWALSEKYYGNGTLPQDFIPKKSLALFYDHARYSS